MRHARLAVGAGAVAVAVMGVVASRLSGADPARRRARADHARGAANAPSRGAPETRLTSRDTGAVRGGTDTDGIPLYTKRHFTPAEGQLLLRAYGVADPGLLYLSDSTPRAIVKVDTKRKTCRTCYVGTYRLGFLSMRRVGESWPAFERRVRATPRSALPASARVIDASLDSLDPEVQPLVRTLLEDARRAGFHLRVIATYRTPQREALLFAEGQGRTYTATSMHSYGRAVDVAIDDGNPNHAHTRADWVRFRRFVEQRDGTEFRLLGRIAHTWDWGHIEAPAAWLGFHSIDDALAFARRCTTDSARTHPPSSASLGGAVADPCVFVPHLPRR